jgi:hypothetical protein
MALTWSLQVLRLRETRHHRLSPDTVPAASTTVCASHHPFRPAFQLGTGGVLGDRALPDMAGATRGRRSRNTVNSGVCNWANRNPCMSYRSVTGIQYCVIPEHSGKVMLAQRAISDHSNESVGTVRGVTCGALGGAAPRRKKKCQPRSVRFSLENGAATFFVNVGH